VLDEETAARHRGLATVAGTSREEPEAPVSLTHPTARPLFRPEVLSARRQEAFGTALIVQPLSTTVFTLAAVAVAIAIGVFVFRGEYTRKARVSGYLVPSLGLIKVHSLETGTIVETRVTEGAAVTRGQVLFVISMERSNGEASQAQEAAMATLRERRASLTSTLAQQRQGADIEAAGLRQQLDTIEVELARLADELKTDQLRVASARSVLEMYERLFAQQLASAEQREQQRKALLSEEGNLQAAQRQQVELIRERDGLQAQLSAQQVKALTDRSATQRDVAALDQQLTEYESRRTFVVTAPADGIATTVLAATGQTATPAQPLMSLLPAGAVLQAYLFVPSQSVGFIAPGQDVAIQYQAFPYQRFGSYTGRVEEISRSLILPGEANLSIPLSSPAYRVVVDLDSQFVTAYGRQFALQAGMQLDANISLDRHRLYQWALDPLYSLKGSV
jgi:membrane fusion protein